MFTAPFINALFGFYYLTGNLGVSVIIVTVLVKFLLWPLLTPSMKAASKMRELQPKLKKLQEKFKDNKTKLAAAQMEMYKQEGVNPMSGCLPQILQIAVLLLFFSAFNRVIGFVGGNGNYSEINNYLIPQFRIDENFRFDSNFLGYNLGDTPSKLMASRGVTGMWLAVILLAGSALTQFWSAKLMMPTAKLDENVAKKTEDKEDDMMAAMRTQSTYFMPLMTVVIGWKFSLGLLLYWFVNSVMAVAQQLTVNKAAAKG